MSLIAGLANQQVDSIKSVTFDGYGDSTETTLYTDTSCRWQESIEQTAQVGGEFIKYIVEAWFFPSVEIEEKYRVTKNSKTYVVVKIAKKYDLSGNHDYTKVYLA
jgi:hypothetical protein